MIRKILLAIGEIFISFLIAFLFIFIIGLVVFIGIKNYKIVLKHYGIYVQDDCQLDFRGIHCNYLDITNKKNLTLNLKNVDGYFYWKGLYKDKPFLYLKIKDFDGKFINKSGQTKNKKVKNKPKKLPIEKIYTPLIYINSKIDNLNLQFENKDTKFILKNAKIKINQNRIKLLKSAIVSLKIPQKIPVYNTNILNVNIKSLQFSIYLSSVFIDKLELKDKFSYLKTSGFVKNNFQYNFKGFYDNKGFRYKEIDFNNIKAKFLVYSHKNINKGQLIYYLQEAKQSGNIGLYHLVGKLNLTINKTFEGSNKLYIKNIKSLDITYPLYLSEINIESKIKGDKIRKYFENKNEILINELKYKNIKLNQIKTEVNIQKYNYLKLEGNLETNIFKGIFYFNQNNNKNFRFISDYISIDQLKSLFLRNIELNEYQKKMIDSVSGEFKINLNYIFLKDLINTDINLKNSSVLGISVKNGDIYTTYDLKEKYLDYSIIVDESDKELYWNGIFDFHTKNLDSKIDFYNININNLIFTKKSGFSGVFSGAGDIYGQFPRIKVDIEGNADYINYKEIKIPDIDYQLKYENWNIYASAYQYENNLTGNLKIILKPFKLDLNIKGNKSDIQNVQPYLENLIPSVFTKIKLLKATGNVNIQAKLGYWRVSLDIPEGMANLTPIDENVYASVHGIIAKDKQNLKVNYYKYKFKAYGQTFDKMKGFFELSNKLGLISTKIEGYKNLDKAEILGNLMINLNQKRISGLIKSNFFKDKGIDLKSETLIEGTFKKIGGVVNNKIKYNNKNLSNFYLTYAIDILDDGFDFYTFTNEIKLKLGNILKLLESGAQLNINDFSFKLFYRKDKPLTAKIYSSQLVLKEEFIKYFETQNLNIIMNNTIFSVENLKYSGIFSGLLKNLKYDYKSKHLSFNTNGIINKEILPEIIQIITLDGKLGYSISFDDSIYNFKDNVEINIDSKNLKLYTPYIEGFIQFKKAYLYYKRNFVIDLDGITKSSLYGENYVKLKGSATTKPLKFKFDFDAEMLPIRYNNLFVGNINSKLEAQGTNQKSVLKGDIYVTGRTHFNMSDLTQKEKKRKLPEFFDKVKLNINMSSFSPIYIYGDWGKVYAEAKFKITGTLYKPLLNGYINVLYGKIYILKNRYNVDFINVKILNNIPYVNARLSTSIVNTFIFVVANGPIDDLRVDYYSIPPMPKDQILATLLLKETPTTLAELPLFSAIGKFIKLFVPSSEEEGGLFNTGFQISILPKYTPVQGIVASIYAQKSITRRLYIALSRALGPIQEFVGWYEIGYRITEQTSIVFKRYETNLNEIEIMFGFPFDF